MMSLAEQDLQDDMFSTRFFTLFWHYFGRVFICAHEQQLHMFTGFDVCNADQEANTLIRPCPQLACCTCLWHGWLHHVVCLATRPWRHMILNGF